MVLFSFRKRPAEIVKLLVEAVSDLDQGADGKSAESSKRQMAKQITKIRELLFISTDSTTDAHTIQVKELIEAMIRTSALTLLIEKVALYDLETRKSITQIVCHVMQRQVMGRYPVADYIAANPNILLRLMSSFDRNVEISMPCASMLRACLRHESLAKIVLNGEHFFRLLGNVEKSHFDQVADAFVLLESLLTQHDTLVAEFLSSRYDEVIPTFLRLLQSPNYVTRRETLKLLATVLLARSNHAVMLRFVSSAQNLMLVMNLLRDESQAIQLEAFHILKLFVGNPNRPPLIRDILGRNKGKMIAYLDTFQKEKEDDLGLMEDIQQVMDQLGRLETA